MISVLLIAVTSPPVRATEGAEFLLQLHNQTRMQGYRCGLIKRTKAGPLRWSIKLEKAAQKHAKAMARRNKLSHKIKGTAKKRVKRVSYRWSVLGENIASGFDSSTTVHKAWLRSKKHCKNLMNQQFTEMGAAQYKGYWVVLLARPSDRKLQ